MRLVTTILIACLGLFTTARLVHAASLFAPALLPATLAVYPAQVAPAGAPRVIGAGLPTDIDLHLALACPDHRKEFDLGLAHSDAAGRLEAAILVPALAPTTCLLLVREEAVTLAATPLAVLPALEFAFFPQAGPPGTVVSFTVHNLVAGSLRVDYAGAAVVGPLAVTAGSYSGSFTVPHDRPDRPGTAVPLRARNLMGSLLLAQAEGQFGSQPGMPPPRYQVEGMRVAVAGVAPGGIFSITGMISPPPSPSQVTILPVWKTATGKLFPVSAGQAAIQSNGSFEVAARVPSLHSGDPFLPQDGDQVGVAVMTAGGQALASLVETGNQWVYPGLQVVAAPVGSNPPQPIPGAIVTVSAWPGTLDAAASSQQANAIFNGTANQIVGSNQDSGDLTQDEKLQMQLQMAACPLVGIPVADSDLLISVVNPPLEENLALPSSLAQMLVNTQLVAPAGAAGTAAQPGLPAAGTPGPVLHYLVTVDAIAQGYGELGGDNLPRTTSFRADYHTADQSYRTPQGALLPSPVVITLPPLPAWASSQLGEIKAIFQGLTAEPETTPGAIPIFSRYYSLAGLPAGIAVPAATSAQVVAVLTVGQKHLLADQGLHLYVDGVHKAQFAIQFSPGIACNVLKGPKVVSKPFYVATATLPNPHLLAPGLHAVRIGATLLSNPGSEVSYPYKLRVDALPASWLATQSQGTRTLEWRTWGVTYYDGWLSETGSRQTLTSGPKTPQTGPLASETRANVMFTYSAAANGALSSLQNGQPRGKALNTEGTGALINPVAAVESAQALMPAVTWVTNGVTKQFGPTTETVVPPITFDLPEAKYGIPFVAELAAGGSVAYGASITYGGTITVQDDGAVQSLLTIDPEADTSGTVYIEGRLLTGLIGKAGASLTASFDLHMPVTYDSTKSKPLTASTYFAYDADFKAWHKWGCVPGLGCAYSKSYPQHLFDGCEQLAGSTGCAGAAGVQAADPTEEPPQFDIYLAANSQGTLMAIWPASLTSLSTSTFDGYAWSTPQTIVTGIGSSDPHLVYLAPNKVLAAWVETTLPPGQPASFYATVPLTEAVKSQRVAYATWDGSGWSQAAALTTPLYGEGNLALAACTGDPLCPAGGAATLVWQRFATADPLQRQIRLYYASYQDGAWGAVQPMDPASTATDILPQVAYQNGVPLFAWVRDSDIDLTDVTSRRAALRLAGGPIVLPAELPDAIGEISLAAGHDGSVMLAFTRAADGVRLLDNRRPLWFAEGTCSGAGCTWSVAQQRDFYGRQIYAERPLVTLDNLEQPTLTFRGLGFGPDLAGQRFTVPGDPPGMRFSTGELVQLVPGAGAPSYLTQDGAVNWMPAAAYQPVVGGTAALVVKGTAPAVDAALHQRAASLAPGLPVEFIFAPQLPDFVVVAEASQRYPQPGVPLQVSIHLLNQGATWPAGSGETLTVAAAWDGAPGIGIAAGHTNLRNLEPGGATQVALALAPPPGGLEVSHVLTVRVNPDGAIAEADATNNEVMVTIGGMSAPEGLSAGIHAASGLVFLQWRSPGDVRIAGYRVYRATGEGPWVPAGSSLVTGWADLTAAAGMTYRYAVTAYTAAGVESPLSAAVYVSPTARVPRPLYLPWLRR